MEIVILFAKLAHFFIITKSIGKIFDLILAFCQMLQIIWINIVK